MGRKKLDTNQNKTEEEIKSERREYMRKYYLKKKHNMVEGEYVKPKPQKPKVSPLTIQRGEFIVSFN